MKKARILLRVSSNQQLEADGDLSVQRRLVVEYVQSHAEWRLDGKEYFEGSMSGYKNAVSERDILQEVLEDARNKEYDILVVYKDDRIGRRMWEMGIYIMTLKSYGVDIYTVKDGCISPDNNDIMGQMMLALRYGNAQKSSADTGMRVKDTAQKLVQQGKFMGGAAPYGYKLVLSGELSKHGRALHRLEIIPEQAEVVKHIYALSLHQELGSTKIARLLNEDDYYKTMAPNDTWKSGTITSILTNPIYTGHVAYKRRERINGKYHRLDSQDWIKSNNPDESIQIISGEMWDRTQDKRKCRSDQYIKTLEHKGVNVIRRNDGMLSLIDMIHCGYCGGKMTNGSKYSYWTIKETGEKRASKTPMYRCQSAQKGILHNKVTQFRANWVEKIVLECLAEYIGHLQENENIFDAIDQSQNQEKKKQEAEIAKLQKELVKIIQGMETMEEHIPEAMTGDYALSLDELASAIRKQKEKKEEKEKQIREKRIIIKRMTATGDKWEKIEKSIPSLESNISTLEANIPPLEAKLLTWQQVFREADTQTQRVLANKLIERIDVTNEQIVVRFKINRNDFLPRISGDSGTIPYRHGLA